jgi:Zn-dependent protease
VIAPIEFGPLTALFFAISLVPAMLLHELVHGWLAVRRGDATPRFMGRLTVNLRPHVDAFGTVVVPSLLLLPVLLGRPGITFGYLKPMPLDRGGLGDRAVVWIALAGIGMNLVLAGVGAAAYRLVAPVGGALRDFLYVWVLTNVVMAALHLVPLPPLDGSRALASVLKGRAREVYESWEPYGALFVLVLLFVIPAPIIGIVFNVVEGLLDLLVGRPG